MTVIARDPPAAAAARYDVLIVGGGVYGVMLAMESARRGWCSVLLERGDFGGATSFNSLRILHGGLRYLQSLDLKRFHESVAERRWFLRTYPDLVRVLPCLMPLYGRGLQRNGILRTALVINDALSARRNVGVPPPLALPRGRVIDAAATRQQFPCVDGAGLKGSAVWYDAMMLDSQRVIMETLRWACENGATALNYLEARELLTSKGRVEGIRAVDGETGRPHVFRAGRVINAAGPWCRELAAHFHRDLPQLFIGSLAWNVLLDKAAPCDHALAVAPKRPQGQVLFLVPWKGRVLAGTGHAPWHGPPERPMPTAQQLREFLDDVNLAMPGLGVTPGDIVRVHAGLLPARLAGTAQLTSREVIIDHGRYGGPEGLWSICGIKFTTARRVAEKTLDRISQRHGEGLGSREERAPFAPAAASGHGRHAAAGSPTAAANVPGKEDLCRLIAEESVHHLDDLMLRRSSFWDDPHVVFDRLGGVLDCFPWDDDRRRQEVDRLRSSLRSAGRDCAIPQ